MLTWEEVNPKLHQLGVESHTDPAISWNPANHQQAVTLLKDFLQHHGNHGIATMHLERLDRPLKTIIDEYNSRN